MKYVFGLAASLRRFRRPYKNEGPNVQTSIADDGILMSTHSYMSVHVNAEALVLERYIYAGLSLSLTAYGFASLLFLKTGYLLLYQRKDQHYHNRKTTIGLLVYLCIAFSLLTTTTICHAVIKTRALIDYRDFPGGPSAYLRTTYFSPPGAVALITGIFVNYATQGLMLYRCYVIFRDRVGFITIPLALFFSTKALGLALITKISQPMNTIWTSVHISLPYFILTCASSVIVTILITTRLLLHRRKIDVLYSKSYGKSHLGAGAILIESCALNAVFGLASVITYATRSPVSRLFVSSWAQIQFIASCLVIYRLAKKRAWTRELVEQFSTRSLSQLPVIHVESVT